MTKLALGVEFAENTKLAETLCVLCALCGYKNSVSIRVNPCLIFVSVFVPSWLSSNNVSNFH